MLVIGDSGHNEYVSGKRSPDGTLKEFEFNHQIDEMLRDRLYAHGIEYYQTNPSPYGKDEIGLTYRTQLANEKYKSDKDCIFISIHANAYGTDFNSVRGVETYIATNASSKSNQLANLINTQIYEDVLEADKGFKNRGVKTQNFTVIYKTNMPCCLIEFGFYTNKEDLEILEKRKRLLCESVVKAICKYFGVTYKPLEEETNNIIYYRVICGSYSVRSNAEAMVQKLKDLGYDSFIEVKN